MYHAFIPVLRMTIYSLLVFFTLISIFFPFESVLYMIGLLAITAFMISFTGSSLFFFILAVLFTTGGAGLYLYNGWALSDLPSYMLSTTNLIAFLYFLPLMNSLIVVGRFDRALYKLLMNHNQHLGSVYYKSLLSTYFLSFFLNLVTLPFMQNVLNKYLKAHPVHVRHRLISQTSLRGLALCFVWSPMEILVIITTEMTGVNYISLFPYLLGFSLLILTLDALLGRRYRVYPLQQPNSEINTAERKKALLKAGIMLVYFLVFIISVFVTVSLFDVNLLLAVTIVIIPYVVFAALSMKRWHSYQTYSWHKWKNNTVHNLQNFVLLFVSLGFFMSVLSETTVIYGLQQPFVTLASTPALFLIGLQILIVGVALIGVHPMVTISLLGQIIPFAAVSFPVMSIALVMITSSVVTISVGPYNVGVAIMGSMLKESNYKVAWWNMPFAFVFSTSGTLLGILIAYLA